MPGLVLQPKLSDFNREEIEQFLEGVRARRMVAAIEYHASKNAKIAHEADKIQRRYLGQVEMLAKEIESLERAEDKVAKRLINIESLNQELGLITDQIVDPNEEVDGD